MRIKNLAIASLLALGVSSHCLAAPTLTLRDGVTAVKLDSGFVEALTSLNVVPSGLRPSFISKKGVVAFPIPVGRIDQENLKGEILHTGGLKLSTATKVVELSQFAIDTTGAAPVITGLATVDGDVVGRLTLFDLVLPSSLTPPLPNVRVLKLQNVGVKLNQGAADTLNTLFGVTAFSGGFDIGVAAVRARTRAK